MSWVRWWWWLCHILHCITMNHWSSIHFPMYMLYPWSLHIWKFIFFYVPLSVIGLHISFSCQNEKLNQPSNQLSRKHRLNGANAFNFLFLFLANKCDSMCYKNIIIHEIFRVQLDKVGKQCSKYCDIMLMKK